MTDASAAAAEPAPHPQLPAAAYRNTALVLRIGLAIALAILLVALIAYLVQNPGASESSAVATNPIVGYLTGAGLVGGLASGAPAAYLTLGVYALVATARCPGPDGGLLLPPGPGARHGVDHVQCPRPAPLGALRDRPADPLGRRGRDGTRCAGRVP